MADETSMALEDLLRKAQLSEDVDFLREGVRVLAQALMELEVTEQVGARRYERTVERKGERNGSRDRRWDTRVGSLTLRVPGCAMAATFRRSWSHAAEPSGRWSRWYKRRMCRASRRGGSTNWRRRWGCRGSARARSRCSVRSWIARWSASARGRWPRWSIPTSGWTPPLSKRGVRGGWSARRW